MIDYQKIESQYSASICKPLPITLTKGKDVYVFDQTGKKYLDMMSAISVANYGHCHPRLIKALCDQANKITAISRLYHSEKLGLLLEKACKLTYQDKAIPMNSGAEAVETAIKAVRKWGYEHKHIPENEAEIIICSENFHGRTLTTISMSSEAKYKNNFGPFTPGFITIPYNNPAALKNAITPNTAAFLVEPIQGEAGIKIPDSGYLKKCEQICHTNNVLLICDEIQCGLGRTGKILTCEYDQVKPDGILLGKALGGGILPISLFLGKNELMNVFKPGDHGSTFGGNPLASAVALEALNVLLDENLIENSATVGAYFINQLQQIKSPLIKEGRGKGLFIGVELDINLISSQDLCLKLMQQGLLCINTRGNVIRFLPPLTVSKQHIDDAVEMLKISIS